MASESLDFVSPEAERFDGDEVIPVIATTVVAFIGRAERGPLNESIPVKSFEGFRRVFGGHCAFSFLSQAVQHFFLHGGEAATVVRVANGATRGALELPAGGQVLRLQALHPGSREFLRVSVDYDRVERAPDRFNLVVQRLARPGSQLVDDQELYESLSMDPADARFVVDALHDSELVRLVGPVPTQRPDATRAERPGEPIPYIGMTRSGSDGDELTDYDIIGSNSEGTGLFALDACSTLDFLCIPTPPERDLGVTTFVAATRYCERRRALLIWDPPWSWMSVHGALLGVRDDPEHAKAMHDHGIEPIDLLVSNLYPFEEVRRSGADYAAIVENIDIGGPAMIRASAKNHAYVAIVTDPGDYASVLNALEMNIGSLSLDFRKKLAAKAFARTASYDAAISGWFAETLAVEHPVWRGLRPDKSPDDVVWEHPL